MTRPLRVLFAVARPILPFTGGAGRITRVVAEGLASAGHDVHLVSLARTRVERGASREELIEGLRSKEITPKFRGDGVSFRLNDVEVHAVDSGRAIPSVVASRIRQLDPDWIIIPTEDWRQTMLLAALQLAPARVLYHAMTTTSLPYGPQSLEPTKPGHDLTKQVRATISICDYLKDYAKEHQGSSRPNVVIRPPVYGAEPFGSGDFLNGYVTMVNPSEIKGLSIFLGLAQAFPRLRFAAVASWATDDATRAGIARMPNVELWPHVDDVDSFYGRTRVLVVPSLWAEAFGLVVVEAMLRGIPVLASDAGGLREAKLGTDFSFPIRPVPLRARGDLPICAARVEQDIAPWADALHRLTTDSEFYAVQSRAARSAATRFVRGLGTAPYVNLMQML